MWKSMYSTSWFVQPSLFLCHPIKFFGMRDLKRKRKKTTLILFTDLERLNTVFYHSSLYILADLAPFPLSIAFPFEPTIFIKMSKQSCFIKGSGAVHGDNFSSKPQTL